MDDATRTDARNGRGRSDVLAYGGDLSEDHPGFTDAAYRERRAEIGRLADAYERGQPLPTVPYAPEEDEVWALVKPRLAEVHRERAAREIVEAGQRLVLPDDHVPQLDEVNTGLTPLTGFRYEPVAGLVSPAEFYGALADGFFRSTQYIRHASKPFYTPEPDVIHEVLGHGTMLAHDAFAQLYREVGEAARRVEGDDAMQFLSRVFWFTMEFGVLREGDELKAYGAGLLSSVGEMQAFHEAEIRELDLVAMGTRSYDITRYQDVLFAAPSFGALVDTLHAFLETYDDDAYHRLIGDHAA